MNDWLSNLAGEWEAARSKVAELPKNVNIPDGNHKAVIMDAFLSNERPMIKFKLSFPDFENIVRTKVIFVSGKLEYVIRELRTIGINADRLDGLEMELRSVIGKVVEIAVKTKAGSKYSDMYFNRDTGETVQVESEADNPENW